VLIDPASLLLHIPQVLMNILYRRSSSAFERLLDYLIREELFFYAHARRHFYWFANVLFLEDVPNIPVLVVLSERDDIIPVKRTLAYVEGFNRGHRLANAKPGTGPVDLVYFENTVHGGFLASEAHTSTLVHAVDDVMRRTSKDIGGG